MVHNIPENEEGENSERVYLKRIKCTEHDAVKREIKGTSEMDINSIITLSILMIFHFHCLRSHTQEERAEKCERLTNINGIISAQ